MPQDATIEQIRQGSVKWLRDIQNADGGWGHYGDRRSNVLNTAEVVLALIAHGVSAGDGMIDKATTFLTRQQICGRDGPAAHLHGAWGRTIASRSEPKPDILRSAFCLQALNAAGFVLSDACIADGFRWLIGVQNKSGGWGFTPGSGSEIFPTAAAVLALLRLGAAGDGSDLGRQIGISVANGLKRLSQFRSEHEPGAFGPKRELWIPHTLYAIHAFAAARASGFPTDVGDLAPVYRWLNGEGEQIRNFCYEDIRLENHEDSEWNYRLTHYTPALYLAIMADRTEWDETAARHCYAAIESNRVSVSFGTYGFAEKRPLAWATAKCIAALTAVDDSLVQKAPGAGTAAPSDRPVTAGPSLGMRLLAILLIIAIAGAAIWLQFQGKFSYALGTFLIAAIVLIFVVLKLGRMEDLAKFSPFGGKGSSGSP